MKRIILATIIVIGLAFSFTGCGGAYRAATVGTQTVSVSIRAWDSYVDTGKPTVAQREAVLQAVKVYHQSLVTMNAAVAEWYVQQGNGAAFPVKELEALRACSIDLIKLIAVIKGGK